MDLLYYQINWNVLLLHHCSRPCVLEALRWCQDASISFSSFRKRLMGLALAIGTLLSVIISMTRWS